MHPASRHSVAGLGTYSGNSSENRELTAIYLNLIFSKPLSSPETKTRNPEKTESKPLLEVNPQGKPGFEPGFEPGFQPGFEPGLNPSLSWVLNLGSDLGLNLGSEPGFEPRF